jgi:hypothetical protein
MHPSGPQCHVRLIAEVIESISFTSVLQVSGGELVKLRSPEGRSEFTSHWLAYPTAMSNASGNWPTIIVNEVANVNAELGLLVIVILRSKRDVLRGWIMRGISVSFVASALLGL